jgi:hypothetical protein
MVPLVTFILIRGGLCFATGPGQFLSINTCSRETVHFVRWRRCALKDSMPKENTNSQSLWCLLNWFAYSQLFQTPMYVPNAQRSGTTFWPLYGCVMKNYTSSLRISSGGRVTTARLLTRPMATVSRQMAKRYNKQ